MIGAIFPERAVKSLFVEVFTPSLEIFARINPQQEPLSTPVLAVQNSVECLDEPSLGVLWKGWSAKLYELWTGGGQSELEVHTAAGRPQVPYPEGWVC